MFANLFIWFRIFEKNKESLYLIYYALYLYLDFLEFLKKEFEIDKDIFCKFIEEKVASFDEKTLEEMLFTLMKKHIGFINFAGAMLGGIIGFVQYFVIS